MPLALEYAVTSYVSPIYQSVAGGPPNTISLMVMVTNPAQGPLTFKEIRIKIPVGADSGDKLSSAKDLPDPLPKTMGDWTINATGSNITIKPTTGTSATIGVSAITFSLDGIAVATEPGTVPIEATEYSESTEVKGAIGTLTKEKSDQPVTSFYASPSSVYDIDSVTLHWNCNENGSNYSYAVSSTNWSARDCSSNQGQNCLSPQDGISGVLTPPLTDDTQFTLKVLDTSTPGHLTIVGTMTVTVPAFIPSVAEVSTQKKLLGSRVVMLHWYAINASSCSVQMDSATVGNNLPTDTYRDGYPFYVTDSATHVFSVTASGLNESAASVTHSFLAVAITGPDTVQLGPGGSVGAGGAVTPDSKLAVVPVGAGLLRIDLTAIPPVAEGNPIPVEDAYLIDIAITADGSQVLVPTPTSLQFFDIATGAVNHSLSYPPGLYPGQTPPYLSITLSPDGKLGLIPSYMCVLAVDVPNAEFLSVDTPLSGSPIITAIAITPDSSLALLLDVFGNILFLNLPALTLEAQKIPALSSYFNIGGIAITPDGLTALVYVNSNTFNSNSAIAVIDIPGRALRGTITLSGEPGGISIPSNRLAFAIDGKNNVLVVLDLETLTVAPMTAPLGSFPMSIVTSGDGTCTIVAHVGGSLAIYQSDKNDAVV